MIVKKIKKYLLIVLISQIQTTVFADILPVIKNDPSLRFEENKGQICDQNNNKRQDVLFSGQSNGSTYFLRNNGISYQFYKTENTKPLQVKTNKLIRSNDFNPAQISIYRIDINWPGINSNLKIKTNETLADYNNYYTTSFPDGLTNIQSYRGITYENIYNNIDLHYYSKNGSLKYDYIVAPHADYKQIKLEIKGADKISLLDDGSILIKSPMGEINEAAPMVFQNNSILKAKWVIENNTLNFDIENYNENYELIIDPLSVLWGTYYGGSSGESGHSIVTDTFGNIFMSGPTYSTNNIATTGSHQYNATTGGNMFLVKFNSAGVRQWGTYYGDSCGGQGSSTDLSGNVYVTGSTYGLSNIATAGSHQPYHSGGLTDGYLVKFNKNGVRQWATYFGGYDSESSFNCICDYAGYVYIAGETYSSSNIAAGGAYQSYRVGGTDAFIAKFSKNGVLQWGTYFGGSGSESGGFLHIDKNNNLFLVGSTSSTNLVATSGAHQTSLKGYTNGFLAKFSLSGARIWSTYYGGTGDSYAYSCTSDKSGNVYLIGNSNSKTDIATKSSHQDTTGGFMDGYLAKFSTNGTRQWATYIGGKGSDNGICSTTDTSDIIYVCGQTTSTTGIATSGSMHNSYIGGNTDIYINEFNTNGKRLYGTYFGGTSGEYPNSVTAFKQSIVYLTGQTQSSTMIATANAHQSTINSASSDAYIVKFCNGPPEPADSSKKSGLLVCSGKNTVLKVKGIGNTSWYSAASGGKYLGAGSTFITPALAKTTTYFAQDSTCSAGLRTAITVTVNDTTKASITVKVCDSFILNSKIYNKTGQYKQYLPNYKGCDSIIALTLIVNGIDTGYLNINACKDYTLNAIRYDSSGIYHQKLNGVFGCDSLVILNLNLTPIDTGLMITSNAIAASMNNANYQWIDCNKGKVAIAGENKQIFSPSKSGNYAVVLSTNSCKDTSACVRFNHSAINNNYLYHTRIFPNPSNGQVTIEQDFNATIYISDATGHFFQKEEITAGSTEINLSNYQNGIYILKIISNDFQENYLLILSK